MKEKKVFKILSIDGGGIKGLYSASILEKFEKTLEKEIKKKTLELFRRDSRNYNL